MGIIKFLTVRFVEVIAVLLLIIFMPSIPPKANFSPFKVTPPQELKGKLALNDRLNGIDRIFNDELKGAEAFAEYNGELYTSLFTGDVVKLSKGHIVPIVKFGKPCAGYAEESICGRPLGLQFDKQGTLFVADAYMGIWKADIKNGQKTLLVSMDKEIEGKKPRLPNAISLAANGDIYWTDSSTEFSLEDGVFAMLADGTGRLIHYNAKTKTNKVLMEGLHFSNGVKLSTDEEFLIVAECGQSRVYRFYLKGPKAGTHDIFADGLPGLPDNINSDGNDGFFISMIASRDVDHPIITQVLGPFPLMRKLVARIFGIIEAGFKVVHQIYPTMYTQMAIHMVGHFESMNMFFPKRVTILHYSKTGELIEALYNSDQAIAAVSEAFIFGDDLYLGSPFNKYIGKLSLKKAGLEHLRKKREVPVQKQTPHTKAPVKVTTSPPTVAHTSEPIKEVPVVQKQAPSSHKQTPPPKPTTPIPVKQSPPTHAPVKQSPPTPTPVKQPPPTPTPVKQTPPTPTPVKQSPQTPAPVKQSPQTPAPVKQSPPTPAPVKQSPPIPTPVKQTPPTPAPVKQSPPTPAQVKQSPPTPAQVKQPPSIPVPTQKQVPPVQKQPPLAPAPVKEPNPIPTKQKLEKETPKVVPVKENAVPKSETVKSKV